MLPGLKFCTLNKRATIQFNIIKVLLIQITIPDLQ